MGKKIALIKKNWKENRDSYWVEIRRKSFHAFGVTAGIPLIIWPDSTGIKILTIIMLGFLLAAGFVNKRKLRQKHLHQFVRELGLPEQQETSWKETIRNVSEFEEFILYPILENFIRTREKEPLMASFWYLFSTLMAVILFGPAFGILGIVTLAIGDTFSTLIGKRWGKHKIIYNKAKSIEGSLAFLVSTFAAVLLFLKFFPQYAVLNIFVVASIAAFAGMFIETIPTVEDNGTIPVGVGLFLWLFTLI